MKGELDSADDNTAEAYPNILKRVIKRGGYQPEHVFNVGEIGLCFKRIPERTYISK